MATKAGATDSCFCCKTQETSAPDSLVNAYTPWIDADQVPLAGSSLTGSNSAGGSVVALFVFADGGNIPDSGLWYQAPVAPCPLDLANSSSKIEAKLSNARAARNPAAVKGASTALEEASVGFGLTGVEGFQAMADAEQLEAGDSKQTPTSSKPQKP